MLGFLGNAARTQLMQKTLSALVMTGVATMAQAEMTVENVAYEIDGEAYEGLLVFDDSVSDPRPGVLMVPNWMGVTEQAAEKAAKVAGSDYVVFVADMYGKDIRPQNADEAGAAATVVRSDQSLMRAGRVDAAPGPCAPTAWQPAESSTAGHGAMRMLCTS